MWTPKRHVFLFPTLNRWRLGGPKSPKLTKNAPKWHKNGKKLGLLSEFFDVEQLFQRYLPPNQILAFLSDSHLRRERTPNFDLISMKFGPGHKKLLWSRTAPVLEVETAVFAFCPKSQNGKYLWIGRSTSKIAEKRPFFSFFVTVNSSPFHGTWLALESECFRNPFS